MTRAPSRKLLFVATLVAGLLGACLSVAPFPTIDAGLSCGIGDGGDGVSCDAGVDGGDPGAPQDGGAG